MRTGLGQTQGMRQELRINPRLYQAMDMLYMPMMDLQQHLKQELLSNPFLELVEPEEEETNEQPTPEQEKAQQQKDEEVDWEEILLNGFEVGGAREQFEQIEFHEPTPTGSSSLADHLREQLQLMEVTPRQLLAAEEIIGNINDEGRLEVPLEEVLASLNKLVLAHLEAPAGGDGADDEDDGEGLAPDLDAPPAPAAPAAPDPRAAAAMYRLEELEEVLAIIQRLDPPGIGARDVRESLLIQMREAGEQGTLTYRLVDEAFEDLKAHRWNDLARRFGVEPAEAQRAADHLARFDPKPGLKYADRGDEYVIPDLVVQKIGDRYQVFLNDTGMPRLRLSRSYQEVARDRKGLDAEQKDFIASKLNSANWMIQAIEQRRQTMLKVMNFIVDRQREFFEKGVEYLKPLTLREVAEVINMHESTVSRVTNEKYVQTPRGVLPLKFFFSSALATTGGEDASARAIRAKLQKMVDEESPAKPLTDQQIVHLFKEQGITIARRTVAKYRDQLGILPARMRKRV